LQGHHGASTNVRALKISAILILAYFVAEITIAIINGSLALFADAAHELSTAVAIAISLVAIRLAASDPTPKRTYGLLRVETMAALLNGMILLGMAVFIIVRGIDRIRNPVEVAALPMYIMAFGGIGLEIASLILMYRGQKESLNIRGSFWHVMNAFLGSLAVIIAAAFISFGQIYSADAWAGIVFAIVLIWAAFGIIRDAFNILVDATPKDVDLEAIDHDLSGIRGVTSIHHIHVRTISGDIRTFSAHIVAEDMGESERILSEAKRVLDTKYRFSLSTVQIENEQLVESDPGELEFKDRREQIASPHELQSASHDGSILKKHRRHSGD